MSVSSDFKRAPFRKVGFGPADTVVDRRADGSLVLKSPHALGSYARCVTEPLARWAAERPDQTYLAERTATGAWRKLTYTEAWSRVRGIAAGLLMRGLSTCRMLVRNSCLKRAKTIISPGRMQGLMIVNRPPTKAKNNKLINIA